MDTWFTVEKLSDTDYVISELHHPEETHCYLVCGTEKAALIDTGMGVGDIGAVVRELTNLPVLVVTTHAHWDHIGGHGCFTEIAVHQKDADWLKGKYPLPDEQVRAELTRDCETFPQGFDPAAYRVYSKGASRILQEGEMITLGGRGLRVIHTPGHTPGHICLWEAERGWLFTGDLVYAGTLDAFYPTTNPLKFYESVRKVQMLSVKKILPGHHRLNIDPTLIADVADGFAWLSEQGKLRQGEGMFEFNDFQIHL